jgi:hypothetical protein
MESGATRVSVPMMMLDCPIGGINPEMNQRMRVRTLGSSPVVRREEEEPQESHAPDET